MKFVCSTCGDEHDLSTISFGADAPDQWSKLSDAEKEDSDLSSDLCVIKTSDEICYFIRGCLELPIIGTHDHFVWGVWCSLSKQSFQKAIDTWDNEDRAQSGAYFGWLCTRIPEYPDTIFLRTDVVVRELGSRPAIRLHECEHPLFSHQDRGVEQQELKSIVLRLLHP